MLKLRVLELLEQHNMTKYQLYKQLGMSYQNFSNMINNNTRSIRYEMIETLCVIFGCEPNDLFHYDFSRDEDPSVHKRK